MVLQKLYKNGVLRNASTCCEFTGEVAVHVYLEQPEKLSTSTIQLSKPMTTRELPTTKRNISQCVHSWLTIKMPVEHRRDSSGTLLFMTYLLQKEKVLFPAIVTKNPSPALIYSEAIDGILAETQQLQQ